MADGKEKGMRLVAGGRASYRLELGQGLTGSKSTHRGTVLPGESGLTDDGCLPAKLFTGRRMCQGYPTELERSVSME